MLLSKEDSSKIEQEINKIVESYIDEINESGKYTIKQKYRATSGFLYRFLMAKNKENHNEKNQENVYKEFARRMKLDDKNLKSYELAKLVSTSVIEGEPVTDQVGNCAEDIKELFHKSNRAIYCVRNRKGLKNIEPQSKASNYYKAGTEAVIVGASYYEKILDAIVEESIGESVEKAGKYIIFSKNPFREGGGDLNKIKLAREVFVYEVDQENFEPVVSYHTDKDYNGIIDFEGEWISRSEGERIKGETRVAEIDKKYFESRQVFIQKSNIDIIKQIEYTDDEEEILNILEMLIEDGELKYLNLDYGINVNERLKSAKERSDRRFEIAKETMKAIDAIKIENYLNANVNYDKEQIKTFKQIEIEAEELEPVSDKKEDKKSFRKRINKELTYINPILGMKGKWLLLKDRKKLEDIEKNGSRKDIVTYIINGIVGSDKTEMEKEILSDILYFQLSDDKEVVQSERIEEIKDKITDMLNLIYFRESGISEKSIYSYIADRYDDDIYSYKNSINRIKDIVGKDAIKQIKSDIDRYVISSKIQKQFETSPKDFKSQMKQFFKKNNKITLDEEDNKSKGNIKSFKDENKRVADNNLFIQIKPKQKDIKESKELHGKKHNNSEDIDI